MSVDFVVDEGTVRSLERELERRAARIAVLEVGMQMVWDYGSGCPISRDCAEIQCDGEACQIATLLPPNPNERKP